MIYLKKDVLQGMVILNRIIAESIDKLVLKDLHKKRSIKSYFRIIDEDVEDFNSFYNTPTIPNIKFQQQLKGDNYNIGKFLFQSEIDNGLSNKYSTGLFYENKNLSQQASVIIVHGWRMDELSGVKNIYIKPFSYLGLNMYYFTLPYHLEREPEESLYSGELMITSDVNKSLRSIRQAITDIRALVKWIKNNRKGKVILIGVSLGGFVANMTAVVEKDIDALISTFYANNIAYSIWNTIPGRYIKKDFEQGGYTYEQLEKAWAIANPSKYKPLVKRENILLLSGMYDHFVVRKDTDYLWESWDRPKRILYPCGHAGLVLCRKKIAKDTMSFIINMLGIIK